jgi:hypothetical protein
LHLHVWQIYQWQRSKCQCHLYTFWQSLLPSTVVQGECDSAITNNKFGWANTIGIIWGKQAIGLLINCKQMCVQQYV